MDDIILPSFISFLDALVDVCFFLVTHEFGVCTGVLGSSSLL
jgi:hypothetical protein